MKRSLWIESEDSFLQHFCRIQRNEATDFYCWDEGLIWPKFTFLRLNSPEKLTLDLFLSEVDHFKKFSKVKDNDLVIKINDEYAVPAKLKAKLRPTGSRLAYLKFDKINKEALPNCELVKIADISGLEIFWTINSSGRTRVNPFESPLWPKVKKSFETGTQYFYLKYNEIPVSCGALDSLEAGYNLWGLATLESHKNSGYMSELIRSTMALLKSTFFVQVNFDELTHSYFLRHCSGMKLSSETWFALR